MAQALLTKPTKRKRLITYEEFLEWDGDNQHVEWVEGEVIPLSPVSYMHTNIVSFLNAAIRTYVDAHQCGVVLLEPFNMKTGPDLPGRAPDIIFVDNSHMDRLERNHLRGPADLVIEVVSPDNPRRDRVEKLAEYEAGGVREYWLIDPQVNEALFYTLGPNGRYSAAELDGSVYHCKVIAGLWINRDWFFKTPLPSTLDVIKWWGLV